MRINITEVTAKIRIVPETERKHENILASASITLKNDEGGYFTISGFTVWKSKDYAGLNITVPQNPRSKFKYVQFESGLGKKINRMIEEAYHMEKIPVID